MLKNSLAVKQGAALFKMASVKKVVKSEGAAKNGYDSLDEATQIDLNCCY